MKKEERNKLSNTAMNEIFIVYKFSKQISIYKERGKKQHKYLSMSKHYEICIALKY